MYELRERTVWVVESKGRTIQTFCKSQKAFEFKDTLEERGMKVSIKKKIIDARP